jgi:type IV secretion system protein VirB6
MLQSDAFGFPGRHDVQWEGVGQYLFFDRIFAFIDDEIRTFQGNMLYEMLLWVSGVALVLTTFWILWQGYRILQGQARNAMELAVDGARMAFVTTLALTLTIGNASAYTFLASTVPSEITHVMTGKDQSAASMIDESMTKMEVAMLAIDALNISAEGGEGLQRDRDRAMWMAGVGVAGPALVGGGLQVMYKVALALFVGFSPLFILSLLFKSTQSLFQKWLLYGIGTMFAQSLMAFMAGLVSKIVLAVSGVFAAQYAVSAATGLAPQSVSGMAMMQGGIGLLLTTALVTIPPTAAYFFQGTLGSYMAYSVFGGHQGAGQRPGEPGYRGQAPPPARNDGDSPPNPSPPNVLMPKMPTGAEASLQGNQDVPKRGETPNRLKD